MDSRSLSRRLREARQELNQALRRSGVISDGVGAEHPAPGASPQAGAERDLIISANELNLHHGTGVLVNRIFSPATSINIRSREDYPDKGNYTSRVVKAEGCGRAEVFAMCTAALAAMEGLSIRRILCVPYYPEDCLIAIACKSILGVPMALWVMDDAVIHGHGIDPVHATELFQISDIRFVISPEMRDAYESRFNVDFHILPPTVDERMLSRVPSPDFAANVEARTCAMIGNIWGRTWFRDFLHMVRDSGWTVHWFGRGSACSWLNTSAEELRAHGIVEMGFIPENELAKRLAGYPFAILPTGTGEDDDDRKNVTLLSLPTRLPFLLAATHTPMLVVGSPDSCSARFIGRFGAGLCSPYDARRFAASLAKMAEPAFNQACRANCAAHAPVFSDENLAMWIWDSCAGKAPADQRFEVLESRQPGGAAGASPGAPVAGHHQQANQAGS